MIEKEQLLLDASRYNDKERFERLLEYDVQQGGVMLYRYRNITRKKMFEIDALTNCEVWASNPDLFDDEFEVIPSTRSPKDLKCVRFVLEHWIKKQFVGKKRDNELKLIKQLYHYNPKGLVELYQSNLKASRGSIAISCFTENSPIDVNNSMWRQYAKNRGICLGYSLPKFVESRVVIDPVYYVNPEERSLGKIFELFGCNEYVALNFCIKDKYGVDKYARVPKTICWAEQNEWRYAIYNVPDKTGKKYANGLYSKCKIVPDVVYIKNLGFWMRRKVMKAAQKNGIPVKVLS